MFEKEVFALSIESESSHYLFFLGSAFCIWRLTEVRRSSPKFDQVGQLEILFAAVFALAVSLYLQSHFFVFTFGIALCVLSGLRSAVEAVGLTLILYVCRPWEVFPKSDWWAQVPRQCIALWVLSWLREVALDPRQVFRTADLSKCVGLSLVFGLWCFATTFISGDVSASQNDFFNMLFRAVILVVILHLTIKNANEAKRLRLAFVVGVGALSFYSLWRFHGFDQDVPLDLLQRSAPEIQRRLEAIGSLGNSNDIAAAILIPLGFLWPKIISPDTALFTRISLAFASCVLLMTLHASQSRGALLAVAVQLGLIFVQTSRRPKLLLLCLAVGVGLLSTVASQLMGRNADDLDASTESRLNYYVTGFRMLISSPIWGQGFGRYPYEFERFSPIILHEWGLRTAHSSWILVMAETGLVGLLLFALINYYVVLCCWRLRTDQPDLLLSYAGYSLTIVFLSHTWMMFPWILFTLTDLQAKYTPERIQLSAEEREHVRA
ncbi:MAG: hypothetical protein RI932_1447 [Pseudomonadota bacterium]|jgi:O-antigen ligase